MWQTIRRQRPLIQLLILLAVMVTVQRAYRHVAARLGYINNDAEALARVIRSEMGNGTKRQRLHIGWATRNLAQERGQTVSEMACRPCGPQKRGRPVSSRQEALEHDRILARQILASPQKKDPTNGATHFVNPRLQDRLARNEHPGYKDNSYRVLRRRWRHKYNWRPYYRLGPELELWGPKNRKRD